MKKFYFFLCVLLFAVTPTLYSQVVINEVYGGGGNAGATYQNDFIELYNTGGSAVNLTGWSVQYASSAGTTWNVTVLTGSIAAHGFYLIQEAAGTNTSLTPLPTPDVTGTINLSATAGKVILCTTTIASTGSNPTANLIDLAGYGAAANYFEGAAPAPAPANATSVQRNPVGQDLNNNSTDFIVASPTPSNSSIILNVPAITVSPTTLTGFTTVTGSASAQQSVAVSGVLLSTDITITPGSPYEVSIDGGANYSSLPVTLAQSGGTVNNITVNIRIAASAPAGPANASISFVSGSLSQTVTLTGNVNTLTAVNPPTAFTATAVSSSEIDLAATGNANADNIVVATNTSANFGTPSGVLVAGNTISGGGTVLYSGPSAGFTFQHTSLNGNTSYFYEAWSVDGTLNYSTGLSANATTNATSANIVINQVYGGGGNSGAFYKNDFIELFNNENTAINVAGWSVQYTSTSGSSWNTTALTGIIPAHGFFLIQEAAGANTTAASLPAPDVTGALAMSATGGKVILCNTTTAQSISNPTINVIDKVGYGTANAFEGSGPAPVTDNTSSDKRITDGVDNNDNKNDFVLATPLPRNSTYITTPPGISSLTPPNGITDIPSSLTPTIIFDKPVVKGTGTITVFENNIAGTPLDVNDASVVISNSNTVALNVILSPGKSYFIQISAGAFKDVYNNNFAGISGSTGWAFTTYNSAVATILPANFDFQNCTGSALLPNGFTQYSVAGAQVWDCTTFGRDPAAPAGTAPFPNAVQINGYANNINNLNRDWLISPKLDLTGTDFPLLSFWSRNAFDGDQLQLKISTDYTGSGNPELATWTDLNGKFPSKGSDVWTASGGINLSAFKQSGVYIAYVYTSTTDDGSRWTLDDISIINSSTPPPPSLTLSASNLEFGYTATASSSTKTLTLTANDLVGDITLTTSGNFDVSADGGTTFGSTITITQATANNLPVTLTIRFSPVTNNIQYTETLSVAISDSTGVVALKGNSIDPASTLNVVDWNLNWFATPDPTLGPTDKSLQETNVAIVLKSIPADLFALQEVVNQHALDSIVNTMPGYGYIINNYGSYSNPNEPTADPLTEVQKLAFVYKTDKFSNIHTDSLLSLGVTNLADLSNPYYNAFASGRFPYMMTADVKLSDNNGGFITHTMRFINIHAKANTAPVLTAYARRVVGAKGLDSLIKADYINENVIMLGDFNDDLNQTITAGVTPPVSSYYPFTTDDAGLYIFPTMPLSPAGQHSDVSYSSVIDNVIATAATGKYYLPSSATVLSDVANLVSKYGTTTTDHYPVFTQYSFSTQAALPVKLLSFTAIKQNQLVNVLWSTSQEQNSKLFDVQRSADGISFNKIGSVSAKGSSNVKTDYIFTDKQPLNGINYYRLKQLDLDDKFVYSSTVKLNFANQQPVIHIAPNPASSYIYVSVENINSSVTLQVFDFNGKLVKKELITQGSANKSISLAGMAKGIYTVKLVCPENTTTHKLVLQ